MLQGLKTKGRIFLFCGLFFILLICSVADCFLRYPDTIILFSGERLPLSSPSVSTLSIPTGTGGVLAEDGVLREDSFNNYITLSETGDYQMTVKLFGLIPVRSVTVNVEPETSLLVGGNAVGIKIFTKGLVCVGTQVIKDVRGTTRNPGKEADIRSGDIFLTANGTELSTTEQLIELIQAAGGAPIHITLRRDNKTVEKTITPLETENGFRLGIWLRDSTAGIGTLTYVDPNTLHFGALGHPIADSDTGTLMPVSEGALLAAEVLAVEKGEKGTPGELKGIFKTSEAELGTITTNTEQGVFGKFNAAPQGKELYPACSGSQVKEGKATILSNVTKNTVETFDVEIQKNIPLYAGEGKDMIIRITDPDLTSRTGGIVQGMSGSPIIQDGKLIGAVTHVFVNDPTKGYGIFIENMLKNTG